ncbi:MAG: PAS domain S-box protein, partial [Bacteroidota bacterium]
MKLESFSQLIVKWQLFLIAGATGILLVLGSYYYHSEEKRIKEEKHNMLKAVADLKAIDIIQFIKERQGDLKTFAESQMIRDNLQLWLKTNNEESKEKLIQRMSLAKKYYDYENVFITSPSGLVFLSLDTIHKLDPFTLAFCKKANEHFDSEYSDLYFCPTHKAIHFDLISPVRNEQHVIDALIILRINPDNYLFPLLQSWPTPSKSSEVYLVRKDGNDVLYLNELKFQKNTALNFRLPITRNDLPAVQAVLGRTGVFEGKDYHGVDVLSDLRSIPGTPWFMISKIDQAEVYSELKYRVFIIFLFATIILILLGTGLAWLYSTRQKNIYKQLYLAKSALKQTQEEFKITLYSIGDAVITTNIDSLILMMNPVAEQLTGWKEQDAKGKPLDEVFRIIHEESHEKVESPVKKAIEQGVVVGLANHTLLISKDGTEIPIADSGAPIRNHDKEIMGVVLVFRDQTKERAAQKSLQETNLLIQNIMDYSPSLIYVVDSGGRFRLVNKGLANLFGLSKEDFKEKVREDFMPKEIAEQHRNNDLLVYNSKQLQSFVEENMESDRKRFYLTSKF